MPPQRKRQEVNVREEVGTIKEGQNQQITQAPDFDSHKGESIEKQGCISSPAKDFDLVQSTGVRIRQKPSGSGEELGRLKYNSSILVRALDQTGQWAFVIANDGKAGWLDKNYAAHPQPEPNAKLYHVKEGMAAQKDILSHYKNQGYSPEIGFDDKDIYKAITIANQGRKGAGIDLQKYEESKNSWGNPLKNLIDGQGDKRATYQAIRFTAGTNIWLPSLSHVKQLREDGVISKRADWLDAGIAAGKGVTAFSDGLVSGFLGGIWDALSGLWDLGGEIISLVGKVVTGEILGDIQNVFKFFKDLSSEKAKEIAAVLLSTIAKTFGDFKANWNNGNFYDKWQFRGKVAGNILLEVVLAIFTGGMGNAAKWLGKLGKVVPKLVAIFQKVVKSVDKAIPDKLKRKDKDVDGEYGEITPEKQKALIAAKVITEKHDAADSSISVLKASLLPITKMYKSVKRFEVEQKKGEPEHYKVWMIASKKLVDEDYTPKKENLKEERSNRLGEMNEWSDPATGKKFRPHELEGAVDFELKSGTKLKPTSTGKGDFEGIENSTVYDHFGVPDKAFKHMPREIIMRQFKNSVDTHHAKLGNGVGELILDFKNFTPTEMREIKNYIDRKFSSSNFNYIND